MTQAFTPTPMSRGLESRPTLKESHTRDQAFIHGLIDKEGNVWKHRQDLVRAKHHPEHHTKYPNIYKNTDGEYHQSDSVHNAWENQKTGQIHEGSPSYSHSANMKHGGIVLEPFHNNKFFHISQYKIDKNLK